MGMVLVSETQQPCPTIGWQPHPEPQTESLK